MADWYTGSVEYTAVAAWTASHAYSIGAIVRQLAAPTVGNERCFRCTTAGTSLTTEPAWTLTKGATTTESGGPVWTEVTGNSAYNWSAPHVRLSNAAAWAVAGDNLYVSHDHAYSVTAAYTVAFPGTAASPNRVFCVNRAGSVPPVSADLRTTGAETAVNTSNNLTISGYAYVWGMTFTNGNAAANNSLIILGTSTGANLRFDSCAFVLTNAASGNVVMIGNGNSLSNAVLVEWDNTTITVASGSTSALDLTGGNFVWRNTPTAMGGTAPPFLFSAGQASAPGYAIIDGVDLSGLGSGKTLVASITNGQVYNFINCKFGSGVTIATTPTQPGGAQTFVTISDSANTAYRQEKYHFAGTLTTDTTDIRSGGASDGTTPIAWNVTTTAGASEAFPFECFEIAKWCATTGSPITVSIPIMSNATLTNAQVWPEVEYLGNASYPLASLASGRPSDLLPTTTGTAWAIDAASTWTTTGVTGPVQQTLSATFTPQQPGWVRVKVKVAAASQTLRIDPKLQGF